MTPRCNITSCKNANTICIPENRELGLQDEYLCPSCLSAYAALMLRRADYLNQQLRAALGTGNAAPEPQAAQGAAEPGESSRSRVHGVSTVGYADAVAAPTTEASPRTFLDKLDELLTVQSIERYQMRLWLDRAASIVARFESEYLSGVKRLEFLDDCVAFTKDFTEFSRTTGESVVQASPETREWLARVTAKLPVEPVAPASPPETVGERWERGTPHDPRSVQVAKSIAAIDEEQCSDSFCWKFGGDGDNGETLMYLLDVHFQREDAKRGGSGETTPPHP